MKQKRIERKALIVSILVNAILALSGYWVYSVTSIQALFLDFFFSFIALLSSGVAVVISHISKRKTKHYPEGLFFLEPLYGIAKSLLTLFLLIYSVMNTSKTAYTYFMYGVGEPLNITPVLPYTLAMVVLCFSLSAFNYFQNKKIGGISTILSAEAKTNFIDGLQSLGVGISIGILYLIHPDSALGFLHYTGDFFITLILSVISFKTPINVLMDSFRELSGAISSDKNIHEKIGAAVSKYLAHLDSFKYYEIYKVGMKIKIYIYFKETINTDEYEEAIRNKDVMYNTFLRIYDSIDIKYCI